MHRFEHCNIAARQRGAALGVGLILLLAMTLSGVFILNSSIMDERMSANHRSQTNAFLAAEAGLLKSQRLLDDNWNVWSASNCVPGESANLFNDESYANDTSFNVIGFDCSPQLGVTLRSEGFIDNLGVSRVLTARYEPPAPDGALPGDAPAAISCLGGGCNIQPGQGKSSIDGRDYNLPPWDSSTNQYRPSDNRLTGEVMPSLFLSDRSASQVGSGKGQFEFCGSERNNCSSNNDVLQFYSEDSFPVVDGQPTHPTAEQFFEPGTPIGDLTSSDSGWGTRESPVVSIVTTNQDASRRGAGILIVDGATLTMDGNDRFEGLVVVRGCGSLSLKGTPVIYGAILVDSRDCEEGYQPFSQGGTPDVAFSMEALSNAGGLVPAGAGGLQNWAEVIQGL